MGEGALLTFYYQLEDLWPSLPQKWHVKTIPAFSPVDMCRLRPERGSCQDSLQQFFYDPADGTCKAFEYSGCEGNGNRFENEEECLQSCGRTQGLLIFHYLNVLRPRFTRFENEHWCTTQVLRRSVSYVRILTHYNLSRSMLVAENHRPLRSLHRPMVLRQRHQQLSAILLQRLFG